MSEKIYKVKRDHLNALGEAAGIIVAFLESIKADDALLNFSAAQALQKLKEAAKAAKKPVPHTHVCQCAKDGKAVVTTVAKGKGKCHCHKMVTTRELADAIGAKVHTVQCYASRKGLGTIDAKTRVRAYDEKAAEAIRRHFDAK